MVAYVALRLASILFYDGMGTTPEELGLGEFDLLMRSVGLLVIIFLLAGIAAELVVLPIVAVSLASMWSSAANPLSEMLYRAPKWFGWAVMAVAFGAAVLGAWRQVLLLFLSPIAIIPTGGLIAYLFWLRRIEPWPVHVREAVRGELRRLRKRAGRWWRITAASFAVVSLLTVSIVVTASANQAGNAVRQGRAYHDWAVPWRADPATVRWLAPRPSVDPLTGRCLMYLGQSNAAFVFYDVDSHRIVRVPSGAVVLLIDTSALTCSRS
ncbi:hypothetical protein [Candidatus Nephthysia bennettiae]|uniref:hypothetical protein n=1 Tax=Candidatus Nephthysia bennettiae TaxID=3127016 RepID=UPI0030C6A1C2